MADYIKIPKKIIYDKDLGDKRVVIFSYLCARRALDGTVAFSTTELCRWSKLKPNYRDGKINRKYYDVLSLLSKYGYFSASPDFEALKNEKSNSHSYRILTVEASRFDVFDNFGMIFFDELERILDFKNELENGPINLARMSSSYILLLLSYLRANMNRDTGRPLCCFRLYKTISRDIGLSERYIGRVVEILDALEIIRHKEMAKTKYLYDGNERFRTNPKVFADYRRYVKDENGAYIIDENYDYDDEIEKQIELLENNI